MPDERKSETPAEPTTDNGGKDIAAVERNRRNLSLTAVNTAKMLGGLNSLFEDVMSGKEYDAQQVKNASNLTNTMIKVLRFEFDVYKHFHQTGRVPTLKDLEEPSNRYKPRDDFTGTPWRKGAYD
jgi:hypothetical protein